MNATIGLNQVTEIAQKYGLDVVSVLQDFDNTAFQNAEISHSKWLSEGNAAEMGYLEKAHASLKNLLPEISSALVFAVKYSSSARKSLPPGHGRIARYAWGRDYHKVLPKKIKGFVEEVEKLLGSSIRWRALSDSNPLLEKAVASEAGIGFYGKNSLIIRPGLGSYTFLAEVLWDVRVTGEHASVVKTGCGSCRRCVSNCPTNAINPEYTVDARKCISYLTIEKRGLLSIEERSMLGDWLFGCDICQEVCPFNSASAKNNPAPKLSEFSPEFGAGEFLSLAEILAIENDDQYVARFAGTPLMRAKREGLVRNAICVAVNTNILELAPTMGGLLETDSSPVIRRHALWAHSVFSKKDSTVKKLAQSFRNNDNFSELSEEYKDLDKAGLI